MRPADSNRSRAFAIAWNVIVSIATLCGVGWFVFLGVAFAIRDQAASLELYGEQGWSYKLQATRVVLGIYVIVVVNWGLLASTLYNRLTIWKRLLLVTLSVAPFGLYEWHSRLYASYLAMVPDEIGGVIGSYHGQDGVLAGPEYFVTYVPPAVVASVVMIAGRGIPAIVAAITQSAICLVQGRSRIVGSMCARCGKVFQAEVVSCPNCGTPCNPS